MFLPDDLTQAELFLYYNMTEGLQNIILSEFNRKLSYSVGLGIKYGIYGGDYEEYKFFYAAYVCASFSVISYDANSELWQDGIFDCQKPNDHVDEMSKQGQSRSPKYIASTKGAEYLAVIKMVLTGDNVNASALTVSELSNYLNGFNDTEDLNTTSTQRRLEDEKEKPLTQLQQLFVDYTENCMETDNELQDELMDINNEAQRKEGEDGYLTCTDFVGLDLQARGAEFKS